jgi:hypothetical protein
MGRELLIECPFVYNEKPKSPPQSFLYVIKNERKEAKGAKKGGSPFFATLRLEQAQRLLALFFSEEVEVTTFG